MPAIWAYSRQRSTLVSLHIRLDYRGRGIPGWLLLRRETSASSSHPQPGLEHERLHPTNGRILSGLRGVSMAEAPLVTEDSILIHSSLYRFIAWQFYAMQFWLNIQRVSPLTVALYLTPNAIGELYPCKDE